MALDHKDLEQIERLIYKSADDVAVSVARSFERLEERIGGVEDRIESARQDITDELDGIRSEVREMAQSREEKALSLD